MLCASHPSLVLLQRRGPQRSSDFSLPWEMELSPVCSAASCVGFSVRFFFSELALGGPAHIGKRGSTTSGLTKSDQGLRVTCAGITAGRLVVPFE